LPANRILQERIGHLLTRPIGRPPNEVRRSYANFTYQAGSWTKPRRVVAKVEWHPGELYPGVGFLVTNIAARRERRCLLQEAWDQRGQGRDQVDAVEGDAQNDNESERSAGRHPLPFGLPLGQEARSLHLPQPETA
jgi:hypothetical protein